MTWICFHKRTGTKNGGMTFILSPRAMWRRLPAWSEKPLMIFPAQTGSLPAAPACNAPFKAGRNGTATVALPHPTKGSPNWKAPQKKDAGPHGKNQRGGRELWLPCRPFFLIFYLVFRAVIREMRPPIRRPSTLCATSFGKASILPGTCSFCERPAPLQSCGLRQQRPGLSRPSRASCQKLP